METTGKPGWKLLGLARLAMWEIRLQLRSGFYAAYGIMTGIFLLILALLPSDFRNSGFEFIVFFDPSFLGYFFAGGLVLLEQAQGILPVFFTRGRGFLSYWGSKVISFLVLSGGSVFVLGLLSRLLGFVELDWQGVFFLILGLVLSVPVFFSLGLWLASLFPRVTDYFLFSSILIMPLMFPLVELIGISVGRFGVLSPIWGGMVVFFSVFSPRSGALDLVLGVGSLVVWNGIAYFLARQGFHRLVGAGKEKKLSLDTIVHMGRRFPALPVFPKVPADIRMLFRDPMTIMIAFLPILVGIVVGRGYPMLLEPGGFLNGFFPPSAVVFLNQHLDNVRSFALLIGPPMYGVLGAFLVLDEKDEGLTDFLDTLPGPRGRRYLYRCGLLFVLYGFVLGPSVLAGGLVHGNPGWFIVSLFVDSLAIPWVFFGVSLIATNKVQGLAFAKIMGILLLPPLILLGLPDKWGWLVGLVPTGWGSLIRLAPSVVPVWAAAVLGLGYNGLLSLILLRRVRR